MNSIQVDAFEVQLGAGMLLQFRAPDGTPITILADAGVHSSGYSVDHVHRKLSHALDAFQIGNRRIDLIVGTHYDADHLKGLVPIIQDESIQIGEIWLPPVADDQTPNPTNASLRDSQYLARKWFDGDDGLKLAREYLKNCQMQCQHLRKSEGQVLKVLKPERDSVPWNRLEKLSEPLPLDSYWHESVAPDYYKSRESPDSHWSIFRNSFSEHLMECSHLLGDDGNAANFQECSCHADEDVDPEIISPSQPSLTDYEIPVSMAWSLLPEDNLRAYQSSAATNQSLTLAKLRKAVAMNAITASHLAEIIEALKARKTLVQVRCRVIPDGRPVKLRWSEKNRKFLPGTRAKTMTGLPELTLLGPSESLVKKHRDKLPVMERPALMHFIPIRSITPSNQISSIFRIEHLGQGILISGDAGCVDYQQTPQGPYFPALLKEFSPVHVLQVAHHGGNNAHFYRVLLESPYRTQSGTSYLILSHATNDLTRPSEAFETFIGELPASHDPQILFTSRPRPDRVQGFESQVFKVVGNPGDVGDVSIAFDGSDWKVQAHAIKV